MPQILKTLPPVNRHSQSPLEAAISVGAWEMAEFLIRHGELDERVRETTDPHVSPLMLQAALAGKTSAVKAMLEAGWEPDVKQIQDQLTPLMAASAQGNAEMVESLLQGLAKLEREYHEGLVDEEDINFHTALWHAAGSSAECVRLLLQAGASPNGKAQPYPDYGFSPLGNAASPETARLLVNAGATVDLPDAEDLTPLCHACLRGNAEVARELLAAGANANWHNGLVAHCASLGPNTEAIMAILNQPLAVG